MSVEQWPVTFSELIRVCHMTDIMQIGDTKPTYAWAIRIAKERDLTTHVFETLVLNISIIDKNSPA